MKVLPTLCAVLLVAMSRYPVSSAKERSFIIDYENDQFLKDGKPFRYVSGTMHYFRVPFQYWADRMLKMRIAGLNAIQTYIEWASHEPVNGEWTFEGDLNITYFLELAQQNNLSVILRPGPFIDAERDMGGLPYWLLQAHPDIKLRTSDPKYLFYVERWFAVLYSKLRPYLYCNGGPIIMVQIENEYGSYPACDRDYLATLRDLAWKHLGRHVVLFSTDGSGDGYLQCGKIPGVYATVDFGSGGDVRQAFKAQRHFEASGPLVNSEFYPGWLDIWGQEHSQVDWQSVTKTLDEMLAMNASVNIYVFHGGTSFGFTSGAVPSDPYKPCITSYDYDAPLSEAGDPTEKYYRIRQVVGKYLSLPDLPLPIPARKLALGKVHLSYIANIWDLMDHHAARGKQLTSATPRTFEWLGQKSGFVLYCKIVRGHWNDPSVLELKGLADRAYVYVDQEFLGILSRSDSVYSLPVQIEDGQQLCILVENQGRMSVGPGIKDFKGLTSNVTLSGKTLLDWNHFLLPFESADVLKIAKRYKKRKNFNHLKDRRERGTMSIYMGTFAVPSQERVMLDTFLHLPGWTKGIAFINGHNLGRYWPVQGPQSTLYVPGVFLRPWPGKNELVVIEQEKSPCSAAQKCFVEFVDQPILNGTTSTSLTAAATFRRFW